MTPTKPTPPPELTPVDAPSEPRSADEVPIPALLRAARGSYGHAIRARLAAGGYDDLPRNGPFVLGGIVNQRGSAGRLVRELGISKQAASQLIDTLVIRGYLERQPDSDDRRRITVAVTERGRGAAEAVRSGVEAVDAELAELLTPGGVEGLRNGLVALCEIRERIEDEARAAEPAA
jgi:DNA-binding MarR family transcriptional regulator